MVWYGLTWSLEYFLQTKKRIDRRGQAAERVFMYYILARNTFDARQYDVLQVKNQNMSRVTDQIRVLRETIEASR